MLVSLGFGCPQGESASLPAYRLLSCWRDVWLGLHSGSATLVVKCFSLASQDLDGSVWNAGLGLVAMLAASESPGLFIKMTCSLAPSVEVLIY